MANSIFRKIVAGITAFTFALTGTAVAGPDGHYTAAEKQVLAREIARITKLIETPCQPAEDTLRALASRVPRYQAAFREYVEAYEAQRKLVADLMQPFMAAPANPAAVAGAAAQPANPTVIDKYNALVAEARKLKLFTEIGPMDGATPGTTVSWRQELQWAYEKWKDRGGASPDAVDPRYFFEGPETLAGNYKASLGPLAQKRRELQKTQEAVHSLYRETLEKLTAPGKLGAVMAQHQILGGRLESARAQLEALVQQIPELVREAEGQVAGGTFEHCYGLAATNVTGVAALPWMVSAARLARIPDLKPVPLPDFERLPKRLPLVLLKQDGVEQYLRALKMFEEQAKIDFEYSRLSWVNGVEGVWDVLSSAAVHIYNTGEFLVKAGIKLGDTAVADLQAIVNLGAYGLGVEDAASWDPTGAVARNKEWAGKVNQAAVKTFYQIEDVCRTLPPASCVAATIMYPVMKPAFSAMEQLGQAMPRISQSMDGMVTALFLTRSKLDQAKTLGDYEFVRDQAAKMEQGAADLRHLTGVIAGEVIMTLALGAGIARMTAKGSDVSLSGAEVKALYESYQQAGQKAQKAISRLPLAADKVDDIAKAAKRGDMTLTEARQELNKVGETLRLNKREFDGATRMLPEEAQEALAKTYSRGLEEFRARTRTSLNKGSPEEGLIDDDLFGAPAQPASKLDEMDVGFLRPSSEIGQGVPRRGELPAPRAVPQQEVINPKLNELSRQVEEEAALLRQRKAELEAQAMAAKDPAEGNRLMEAANQLGKPVSTTGTRITLNLPGLRGEFALGQQLGDAGSFKTAYRLLRADGTDSGKVIAIIKGKGDVLKKFFASEMYSDDLAKAMGDTLLQTDETLRLANGDWAIVMDNFNNLGIRVGDSLVADELGKALRSRFLSDPALRPELEAWARKSGKTLEQLTGKDCEALAGDMALRKRNGEFFAEARQQAAYRGLTDEQIRARFIQEGKESMLPAALKSDAEDFAARQLGVVASLPPEAQEAAFKLLLKQAREGVVNGDLKPGNVGFREVDGALEARVTDKGGRYLVDDDAVREFGNVTGAVNESQRVRAALGMYAQNTSEVTRGAIFGSKSVPATPNAIGMTFDDKLRSAIEALSRDLNADISGIVGGDMGRRLNAYAREMFGRLPDKNSLLEKMGQGLKPGQYNGYKGIDPVPPSADEFLAAKEPVRSPPKADVAKAKAAQESLERANEQKVAKELEEASAKDQIKTGMCDRIKSRVIGGAGLSEIQDLAGRGFGCDVPNLLDLEAPKIELPKLDFNTMLHRQVPRVANDVYFTLRRAA